MNRARTCMIVTLVAASAIGVAAADGPPPEAPARAQVKAPDAEHARLIAMCGTWDVEMTFWLRPGGPGLATKGTSTIRPLLDGRFVEEKIDGTLNGTPFTTLAWTGFNTDTHQYEATRISSTNTMRIAEAGRYDEQTRQFELKGRLRARRRHVAPADGDPVGIGGHDGGDQLLELRRGAGVEGRGDRVRAQSQVGSVEFERFVCQLRRHDTPVYRSTGLVQKKGPRFWRGP